jgi:hypothetical protein
MTKLDADELAAFYELGLSIEARWVSDDEWSRAIAEDRVQEAYCFSSMGTAETGWRHASFTASRESCAIVPPGQIAEHTERDDLVDDRDTIAVCWSRFWDAQRDGALAAIPNDQHEAFLDECAHMLVELEQKWDHDRDNPNRLLLVDWLISANKIPRDKLEDELYEIKSSALHHLVYGVRARWITRKLEVAYNAVLASALRFKPTARYYNYDDIRAVEREARMALLRLAVRLARGYRRPVEGGL